MSPATAEDLPEIVTILAEASAWLLGRGIRQWPGQFPQELLVQSVANGELFVVLQDGQTAGTVTLQWADPMFWGDRSDAGFVHRLAISRAYAGIGKQVIWWAQSQVLAHGRNYLCLDTLTSNARLCRYYEDLGFSAVGEASGPLAHPHTEAHGFWRATLYEKFLIGRAP